MSPRHFVLVLHSHLLEVGEDGREGFARAETDGPIDAPRIHVWACTPADAMRKLEERLDRLLGERSTICVRCGKPYLPQGCCSDREGCQGGRGENQ